MDAEIVFIILLYPSFIFLKNKNVETPVATASGVFESVTNLKIQFLSNFAQIHAPNITEKVEAIMQSADTPPCKFSTIKQFFRV